jgi:uncharacterized membrane protein YfhO
MKNKIIDLTKYFLQIAILIISNYTIGFNNTVLIALAYLTYGGNK